MTYIYEQELINSSNEPSVFKLSVLANLYSQRLISLGVANPVVNKTRLKEKLLHHVPELNFFQSGRDILLSFHKDVGPLLSKASLYSDALLIEKAALLLRREMLKCRSTFHGNFQEDYINN